MRIDTWKVLDASDIGDEAQKVFGKPLNGLDAAAQTFEYSNDSTVGPIKVPIEDDGVSDYIEGAGFCHREDWVQRLKKFETWKETTPPEDVVEIIRWEREKAPDLYVVLDALHKEGSIEAGEYYIHCWW